MLESVNYRLPTGALPVGFSWEVNPSLWTRASEMRGEMNKEQ